MIKVAGSTDCQSIGVAYHWELEMDSARVRGHKLYKSKKLAFEAAKKWAEQHITLGTLVTWKDPKFEKEMSHGES